MGASFARHVREARSGPDCVRPAIRKDAAPRMHVAKLIHTPIPAAQTCDVRMYLSGLEVRIEGKDL